MISAKKCRVYAAECESRASSSDISTQQSLEQSIMALNWSALAYEIDRERPNGIFAAGRSYGALKPRASHSSSSSNRRSRRLIGVKALLMARSAAATAAGLLGALPIINKFVSDTDHGQTPRSMP
jgi:hypothetical protein